MDQIIRDALEVGIMVTMQPPMSPRDRGIYVIEAYRHRTGARAKRCITDLDNLGDALSQCIAEVVGGVQIDWVATDDGSDLV